jgi:hypothetical protein
MAALNECPQQDIAQGGIIFNDQEFQGSFSRHVFKGNY